MKKLFTFVLLSNLILVFGCSDDAVVITVLNCIPEGESYDANIRPLLLRSCAYSGCHDGNLVKDYSFYGPVVSDIESEKFKNRVFDLRDMPPSYAPEYKPESLTSDELEKLMCWIEAGYPEN